MEFRDFCSVWRSISVYAISIIYVVEDRLQQWHVKSALLVKTDNLLMTQILLLWFVSRVSSCPIIIKSVRIRYYFQKWNKVWLRSARSVLFVCLPWITILHSTCIWNAYQIVGFSYYEPCDRLSDERHCNSIILYTNPTKIPDSSPLWLTSLINHNSK